MKRKVQRNGEMAQKYGYTEGRTLILSNITVKVKRRTSFDLPMVVTLSRSQTKAEGMEKE
uniref:Uncharacterized protein n=1 Tax=Romanomermis culicivorax TaxID=13658 RepID=A0A915I8L3_ROMCU